MRASLLACLVAVPVVAACSAPLPDGDERDAAEGAATAAILVVERTVSTSATAGESARSSVVARFLRARSGSLDDDSLRIAGAVLDTPEPGSCTLLDSQGEALAGGSGPSAVELLDVGPLAVESNGIKTPIEARALPDIVDLVTGVVYAARGGGDADPFADRGEYTFTASSDATGFVATATAPGTPDGLLIAGQDGQAPSVALVEGRPIDLEWDAAADSNDLVYVDVVPRAAESPAGRCAFADRGTGTIPAAFTGSGDGSIIVHRVHREAFQSPGMESGVIRFDFARAVEFSR